MLQKKKMSIIEKLNWSLILGILAGIIAISAAIAQWSEKKKEEVKANLSEEKADKAQKELKSLQLENLNKTNDLAKAYKEIANLQNELKNEITGGNSAPMLNVAVTKIITDKNVNKSYFILSFDIINKGKYPLQNLKCTVYDNWGIAMQRYGVKHFRDGLSFGISHPTENDIKNYKVANHFDIGTITNGKTYQLYVTTISPELSNLTSFGYPVEIQWNNGSLLYFVNLKAEVNSVKLESVELSLNGNPIKDYTTFLKVTN